MLVGIGLWASRRVRNETDFLLGGRNLGAWVAGLSYAASTSSAWVLLGFSAFTFTYGISALWMLPGIWGGYIVMWGWFGSRIRAEASDNDWITPTDFLCANLERRTRVRIAAVASVLILFCFVFYIAAQFDAAATAFVSNFDMRPVSGLLLGAGIILVYCLLGGFWAASVTDTLQAVVMLLAAIVVPLLAVLEAGGPVQILTTLGAVDSSFMDVSGGHTGFALLGFTLGLAGIGLGTLGQPHLLARLMAVKGERERKQGFAIAMTWAIVVYVGMSSLALAARSLSIPADTGEKLFYLLAGQLLPPVLAGIVIAAILSAVMSTVDSLLMAASAAVAHDLGLSKRFLIGELWVSRFVMTAIVIAAVILAIVLPDTIFNRVLFAWSALGAAFGPLIIARVSGREPSGNARLWAILLGFGLTVLFYSYGTVAPDTLSGASRFLAQLAHLPGDPFERVIPFLPPVVILFLSAGEKKSEGG